MGPGSRRRPRREDPSKQDRAGDGSIRLGAHQPKSRLRWGLLSLAGIALVGIAVFALSAWRFQRELDQAKRDMTARNFQAARGRLERLAAQRPNRHDVAFELGVCRQTLNDLDAALAIWKRIPPESPFAERAALYREQVDLARGRWADVEATLTAVLRHPGPLASELRSRLARLLRFEGRVDEVAGLLEANWEQAADPAALLREHAGLDLEPLPVEMIRSVLDDAGQKAPDDDRVWLGQANWATRSGRFEEAARRLDQCRARRPSDPPVWLAELELAIASGRTDDVTGALAHIPARSVSTARVAALRAWLAAHSVDRRFERKALEAWRDAEPGSATALERLAELADREGDRDRVVDLRRRKSTLDRDRRLYRSLINSDRPAERAAELAPLAEALGRHFEARGWWSILARQEPSNTAAQAALKRLRAAPSERSEFTGMLASLVIGPELGPLQAAAAGSSGTTPKFEEIAEASDLIFTYDNGKSPLRQVPETMGGGVALLDYDGDGWLDVYAVQGGPFPPPPGAQLEGDRLFRNRGDGTFEDVSKASGISTFPRGYGHGVTVGDYDNDGHPDLFVTRWRAYALYHNRGDGTFEDATAATGLDGDRDWPTSAAFADLDGDGDLDLYVCHYLAWNAANPRLCRDPTTYAYIYCMPHILETLSDHVFRNDHGTFVDVTKEAGIVDTEGPGLGVVAADFDDDGRVDLFVANDGTANFLLMNRGDFRFEDVALEAGAASNAEGGFQSGMGVAGGDLDGDGRADVIVTNFYGEGTTFFQNLGGGRFADRSAAVGITAATRHFLGFGTSFLDFNNDGHLDIATANGHVNDFRPKFPYAMPAQLLAGSGGDVTRLTDVSRIAGRVWAEPHVSRGLACGDLDNDGRVDVVMVPQAEPLILAHNQTAGGHFLTLRLEGGPASNRDAIGAKVTVANGDRRQVAWRSGGGSYQSAGDPRLHFGLAQSERVDWVEVRWPSGRVDRFPGLPADRGFRLREGKPTPLPLDGFPQLSRP